MNDHRSPDAHFRTSLLEENDGPAAIPPTTRTMGEIIAARFSRRGFLKGSLAVSAIAATVSPLALITADDARAAGGSRLHLRRGRGRRRRQRTTSPRAMTPTSCCAGATRSSPTAPDFDPTKPDRRGAGQAVRLQQRLCRLHPDRRLVRARPAGRQPRIHQPASDVPRHRHDRRRTARSTLESRRSPRSRSTSRWPRMAAPSSRSARSTASGRWCATASSTAASPPTPRCS